MSKLKRILTGFGIASVAAGAAWVFFNRRLFVVSDVTTGESSFYPDLRAHIYFANPSVAISIAKQIVDTTPGWRRISLDDLNSTIYAEVEGVFGGLLSDLTIEAIPFGGNHTRVVIRSKSRSNMNGGDLGENARNIQKLQIEMDQLLIGG